MVVLRTPNEIVMEVRGICDQMQSAKEKMEKHSSDQQGEEYKKASHSYLSSCKALKRKRGW